MTEHAHDTKAHPHAKAEHHEAAHKKSDTSHGFLRAAGHLINLAQVASVTLPVEGDPTGAVTMHLTTGTNIQLVGEDAEAAIACLADVGDVAPAKKKKAKGGGEDKADDKKADDKDAESTAAAEKGKKAE